jgi:hypothetical protein
MKTVIKNSAQNLCLRPVNFSRRSRYPLRTRLAVSRQSKFKMAGPAWSQNLVKAPFFKRIQRLSKKKFSVTMVCFTVQKPKETPILTVNNAI